MKSIAYFTLTAIMAVSGGIAPSVASAATVTSGELIMNLDAAVLGALNHGSNPNVPALYLEEFFDQSASNARTRNQIVNDHLVPGNEAIPSTGLRYEVNGPTVTNPTGRFIQPTIFSYDPGDVTGTATGQIGLGGVMRMRGDFNGIFIMGDFTLSYDAKRITEGGSGWYLKGYFDNFQAPTFDMIHVTTTAGPTLFTLAGDLTFTPLVANAFFNGDGTNGKVLGAFTFTSPAPVPLPAAAWLFGSGLIGLAGLARRRRHGGVVSKIRWPICLVAGLLVLMMFYPLGAVASVVNIDTVLVGNAGNAADPLTGYGAVSYNYYIGTTEVTNGQYAAYLNSVDPHGINSHDVYNPDMSSDLPVSRGGIDFDPGASAGNMYSPKPNHADKPVSYVNFYDAARFANWVMTGDTENGFYTFSGTNTISGEGAHGPNQHNGVNWVALPSENEWYKAAYHQNDGVTGNYFLYPTSSTAVPTVATSTPTGDIANPGQNVANYSFGATWGGAAGLGNVTTVGSAGPGSASPYGTFDQGGNQLEWNDTVIVRDRGIRGGSLWLEEESLRSTNRGSFFSESGGSSIGFRLASLEPISVVPIPADP